VLNLDSKLGLEMKHEVFPSENGAVIDVIDGWKIKQYYAPKAGRWYVTISQNSALAAMLQRHRLLRSHFVYMRGENEWIIPFDHEIHHKNFDRLNDAFSNLQLLTSAEHRQLHAEHDRLFGRPSSFEGRKHTPETIEKMKVIAQARGNNSIWDCPKTYHFESTKALMTEQAAGENNAMFRVDLDPKVINEFYANCKSLKETADRFGCSVSAIRYRLDRSIYERKTNPLSGRERTYRFDDVEMFEFYQQNGAEAAAEKYGCTAGNIYYRIRAFKKEKLSENSAA
jgi:hypothetical protein